ncbi:MAG: MFS transporter [Ilumatobacteraceae bacterium]
MVVRFGIVLALPFAVLADRIGRRRMIVLLAWLAPLLRRSGSLAPNFRVLTCGQTIARPLELALDLLIAVAAAEEMPRNSPRTPSSVLSDGEQARRRHRRDVAPARRPRPRRVAVRLPRRPGVADRCGHRQPKAHRDTAVPAPRRDPPRWRLTHRRARFAIVAGVAFLANVFIAPASFFQNRYLDDVRGYNWRGSRRSRSPPPRRPRSASCSAAAWPTRPTPPACAFAFSIPLATGGLVPSFVVGGVVMWIAAFVGGLLAGIAYPAFSVYRTEMFPTGRRGRAGGLVVAAALVGGSVGILVAGDLVDRGWSYGRTMGVLALAQVVTAAIVFVTYPETAHRTLEEINPEDAALGA